MDQTNINTARLNRNQDRNPTFRSRCVREFSSTLKSFLRDPDYIRGTLSDQSGFQLALV